MLESVLTLAHKGIVQSAIDCALDSDMNLFDLKEMVEKGASSNRRRLLEVGMQLNRYTAQSADKSRILRAIGWCRRNHLSLAGLPFDEKLTGIEGINLDYFPPGMSREMLTQAISEGYSDRDVVRHRILECPLGLVHGGGRPVL